MQKQKRPALRQTGIIHLAVPIFALLAIVAVFFGLLYFGVLKNPFKNIPLFGSREPQVQLKAGYENPFKKETQYVNPFETYKNPFTVAK